MGDIRLYYARRALKIFQDIGDEGNVENAIDYCSAALFQLSRFTEAIALREMTLESSIKKHGVEHERPAKIRYDLAIWYIMCNQWAEAESQLRISWDFWRTKTPMGNLTHKVQAKLGWVLRESGKDVDEATRLYKELLDYETKVLGRKNPKALAIAVEHARCLQLKGLTVFAMETYREAYPIMLKTSGKDHFLVKKVRSWMEGGMTEEKKE